MATIAAIIATCDRPELLPRALESARRQQTAVDEIIVVNDGLVELGIELGDVLDLAGVRLVRTGPYAGPAAARNAGAAAASSEVLAFLDDDDRWSPEHITEVKQLSEDSELVLTAFRRQTRSGDIELRVPPPTLVASDWLVQNRGLQGSNVAIRREAFTRLLGFDELLWCAEDIDFAVRCADLALRYRRTELPTVTYHSHTGTRITSPGPRHRHSHRTFLAAHGSRMTIDQVRAFRERTMTLFGVDPGPVPQLVWVLGPPGAGKSTWASRCAQGNDRVLDLADAMIWLDGADLGVRTAKRHVAAAIRATEAHRPPGARRLFVTAAYLDPDDLGQLQSFEHIVAIVPPTARWRAQLAGREGYIDERHAREHALWTSRYGTCARAANGGVHE